MEHGEDPRMRKIIALAVVAAAIIGGALGWAPGSALADGTAIGGGSSATTCKALGMLYYSDGVTSGCMAYPTVAPQTVTIPCQIGPIVDNKPPSFTPCGSVTYGGLYTGVQSFDQTIYRTALQQSGYRSW